jgi:TPR repeat protein
MSTLFGKTPDRNDQPAEHQTMPLQAETAPSLDGEDRNRHAQRHCADGSEKDGVHRLDASIRWLKDETPFHRLPRATPLPAVPGLPALDAEKTVVGAFWRSLGPERLAPPRSLRPRRVPRGLINFTIASAVAAPLAYYFAVAPWLPTTRLARDIAGASASIEMRLAAILPTPPPMARDPEDKAAAANTLEEKPAVAEVGTMPEPNPLDRAAPPSSMAPSHPDAAPDMREIAALIERGRRYFEAGDLAAARLVFRRAANAGDASAALAMGTTYDPAVLANRFVRGMSADLDQARSWYEKARELGSPEGPRQQPNPGPAEPRSLLARGYVIRP